MQQPTGVARVLVLTKLEAKELLHVSYIAVVCTGQSVLCNVYYVYYGVFITFCQMVHKITRLYMRFVHDIAVSYNVA